MAIEDSWSWKLYNLFVYLKVWFSSRIWSVERIKIVLSFLCLPNPSQCLKNTEWSIIICGINKSQINETRGQLWLLTTLITLSTPREWTRIKPKGQGKEVNLNLLNIHLTLRLKNVIRLCYHNQMLCEWQTQS